MSIEHFIQFDDFIFFPSPSGDQIARNHRLEISKNSFIFLFQNSKSESYESYNFIYSLYTGDREEDVGITTLTAVK